MVSIDHPILLRVVLGLGGRKYLVQPKSCMARKSNGLIFPITQAQAWKQFKTEMITHCRVSREVAGPNMDSGHKHKQQFGRKI